MRRSGGSRADSPSGPQLPSHQEQVAERKQREELSTVLDHPPVAGLHVAELAFDDPEGMLDLRAHDGDDAVGPFVEGMQRATVWRFAQFKRKANDPGGC